MRKMRLQVGNNWEFWDQSYKLSRLNFHLRQFGKKSTQDRVKLLQNYLALRFIYNNDNDCFRLYEPHTEVYL